MRINNFRGQTYWEDMPKKIDVIDRKIMYLLCKNARLSNTAIGKALKIKREVVSYRIKKMTEEKFLFGFTTRINPRKLGFIVNFVHIKLKTPINEKEFVDEVMKMEKITGIENTTGNFDLWLEITSRSMEEFDATLKTILNKYGPVVRDYKISHVIGEKAMDVDILLENAKSDLERLRNLKETKGSSFQRELDRQKKDNAVVDINHLDKKILSVLKLNARLSIKDLAGEVGSNFNTVNARIKRLVEEGVITTFTTYFSLAAIGYQMFPILLQLRNVEDSRFSTFIEAHPNILWNYNLIGKWNKQINIFAKNNIHLHEVLNDIREEFPENIVSFDSMMVFNIFKLEQRVE